MKKIIVLTLIVSFYGCAKTSTLTTQKLLEAQRLNVLEQPIIYPTQQPGEETGWHKHMVPLHAYLMEGTSTIDFEVGSGIDTHTFSKG